MTAIDTVITKTPYRVSFFGGGSDYPSYYQQHGGCVLGTTIDKYCYLSIQSHPVDQGQIDRHTVKVDANVGSAPPENLPAVMRHLGLERRWNLSLSCQSDVPSRSGLGSSSAYTVGLIQGLALLSRRPMGRQQLTRDAIHVEQYLMGDNVGSQDQTFAAHGGLNRVDFHRDGSISVQPIAIPNERREDLERHLMLAFTGVMRQSSDVAEDQIRRVEDNEGTLKTMKSLVDQAQRVLTGKSSLSIFGELLDESWRLKKSLSERISSPMTDDLYERACRAGAIGGKLLGAGGGGFLLLFVPRERQVAVREELTDLSFVRFSLSSLGSQAAFHRMSGARPGTIRPSQTNI